MKKILPSIMLGAGMLVYMQTVHAQVKTRIFFNKVPAERIKVSAEKILVRRIESPRDFKTVQRNAVSGKEYSLRYALPKEVDIDILSESTKIEESGFTTYALTLHASDAINLSLTFKEFNLSKRSILSIYTDYELTDSITFKQNNESRKWATRVYQGNKITLLLRTPAGEKMPSSLKIGAINFGFKKFGNREFYGKIGASEGCNINVACAAATGWNPEENSVALIVINGAEACSGTLVMNTCSSNRPFVLTANHCLGSSTLSNWVFQYQTWSTQCTTNTGWAEDVQFNGANLRANDAGSDFALVEMFQVPAIGSGITYSGWDRTGTAPNGSVGLHHPEGDLMKFSRDFDLATTSSWSPGTNNHWQVNFDQGTAEPGSSGSALFDMNHRVVGQLHGVQSFNPSLSYCAQTTIDYGRFDLSWTGGGTNSTRLSNWLDPSGSGATTANTTNISALTPNITGNPYFCTTTSGNFTVQNVPPGASIAWTLTPYWTGTVNSPTSATTTVDKIYDWDVVLTATLTGGCAVNGSVVVNKDLSMGFPSLPGGIVGSPVDFPYSWYHYWLDLPYNHPPYDSYTWSVPYEGLPGGWSIASGNGTDHIYTLTGGWTSGGPVQLTVNYCGIDRPIYTYVEIGTEGGWIPERLMTQNANVRPDQDFPGPNNKNLKVSPNPVRDQVLLTLVANIGTTRSPAPIRAVRIIDKAGRSVKLVHFNNNQSTQRVSLVGLPPEIYSVSVFDGKIWYSEKLIVVK